MTTDFEAYKALIDTHFSNLSQRLDKMEMAISAVTMKLQDVSKEVAVELAKASKDIERLDKATLFNRAELEALKSRFTIHEDTQDARWTGQEVRWNEQKIRNEDDDDRTDRIRNFTWGVAFFVVTGILGIFFFK